MSRKHDQPYNSSISKDRLSILFRDAPAEASGSTAIAIERICLPASQPRRYFDPAAMQELTDSIQKHGILQPLIVRPIAAETYELVAR
ncbi:MAG: ParB N-terminal domain-containing protein [Microcoleus sp. SIO2G3]|nr:ParB N-terminal domain-containing protein [Microcoleus sp. SIO2G3]